VNGLRACLKKGFLDYVRAHQPDLLCLSEVKCTADECKEIKRLCEQLGYRAFWNCPLKKKGYSGVLVLSKVPPLSVVNGMNATDHDGEGRVIALEFSDFYLVAAYIPNAGEQLDRLDYRTKEWDPVMTAYLKRLKAKKPVIWTGDLN